MPRWAPFRLAARFPEPHLYSQPDIRRTASLSDPVSRLTAALERRYAIERELGRGGMGTVYLALDRKHGRKVAIKVLPPDVAAAIGPERFLREIQIVARLSHPHILPLHDSGHAGGLLYYVMPWVEGESLRARLEREGRLPVDQALAIGREIADALSHAHGLGVIHRDVKPENILLAGYSPQEGAAQGGHALLADFGVARSAGSASPAAGPITESGLPLGTPAYASPEQAAGSRALDGRSDIYSLGCVLYELLVGTVADGGASAGHLLERRFGTPVPLVRTLRPEVPAWVDGVLSRAMAGSPADRFASAGELRDALRPPPLGSVSAPAAAMPPSGHRQRRLVWMAAGASAAAIAVAAVAFLPHRTPSADPKQVVVAGFENKTGDSALAPVGDIATDYIARGLAATRLMHEIYDARATAREAGEPVRVGAAAGRALAKRVGAGTVLWGNYYRDGDSLHFEAQLVDAPSGKVIVSLEPAVGLLQEKTRVVEILRQRVMAGFAVVFGSEFDTWKAASLPPTYEAYQEMIAAGQTEFDFSAAVDHFRRAAALDSSFTGAQTSAAVSLWLEGDCAGADSIVRRFEARVEPLPPIDRGQLDIASAGCQGDTDAAVKAVRATVAASPRSAVFTILGAVIALEHLRPRDGLEILRLVDPHKLGIKGRLFTLYMDWLAMTYHMLGDHRRELETARAGLRANAGSPHLASDEAAALAALGRIGEAERLALGFLPARHSDDDPWPAPMATECVALELRAHGHPEAAQRVLERVVAWYGTTGVIDATREDWPCARPHFSVFYYAGRWDEARAGYEHLLAEDTTSLKAHAALGALAVRRRDRAEADRMDAWLASRPKDAGAAYSRARLAALGGDRERAVALLQHAFDLGLRWRMFLHLDPDFESLREYPPYQELIRPKE